MLKKIPRKDMAKVRAELFRKQQGLCPISHRPLPGLMSTNLAIDHDHDTGVVRAVLPKGINGLEGKVKNLLDRWGQCTSVYERIAILRRLADYWELHITPQTEYIYPTHKTPDEQRLLRNKRSRAAYAKKKEKAHGKTP